MGDKSVVVTGTISKNSQDIFAEDYLNQTVKLSNPFLSLLVEDHLYHLALTRKGDNLEKQFGDVKFVCTGGSAERMEMAANMMRDAMKITEPLEDITREGHRYSMFKVGPVLFVNHGMGIPSLAILMHELFKLLAYAKCKGVVILRLGTCGGLGKPPGTLVITEKALDDRLRPVYEQVKLGKIVPLKTMLDTRTIMDLKRFGDLELPDLPIVMGTTMATNEFYEGQGRVDGAFCDFTMEDRQNYLNDLKNAGVVNIEMEANAFTALCLKAHVKCALVNVVIVDRLKGDQVSVTKEEYTEFSKRPAIFAIGYIMKKISNRR